MISGRGEDTHVGMQEVQLTFETPASAMRDWPETSWGCAGTVQAAVARQITVPLNYAVAYTLGQMISNDG